MAGALDVVVRFIGDASSVTNEVSKIEGTGSRIKSWAKGVALSIGAAFAVAQLKEAVSAASALEDQVAAAGVVFEDGTRKVRAFASTAAEAFGIAESDALNAANTFAAFGKAAGLSGKELAGFSTEMVGLAGDMASFRGTSPEQAIQAIGAALRGESEPIRAYGVLLDEATLQARALSLGLVKAEGDTTSIASAQLSATSAQKAYNDAVAKHGAESAEATTASAKLDIAQRRLADATAGTIPKLTQQQRVLAAQAEILAQTGDAQGDFGRTADSAANQQKVLAAEMRNAQAAIGTALLPVLKEIMPVLQSVAGFVKENAHWLVPLAAGIIAVNIALTASPLTLILAGIIALVVGIKLLIDNFDKVKAAVEAAFNFVLDIISGVWEWIKAHWPLLLSIIIGPFGLAVGYVVRHFEEILDFIKSIPGKIADFLSGVFDIVTAPFRTAVNFIKGIWNDFARGWNGITIHIPSVDVPLIGKIGGGSVSLPDLPTLARGGIVTRPMAALIGEAGPEAVVPLKRGGGVGNTTFNVTVNVPATANAADVGRSLIGAIRAYERSNGAAWRAAS
jgi:hypothetical protein